eukprot:707908_1
MACKDATECAVVCKDKSSAFDPDKSAESGKVEKVVCKIVSSGPNVWVASDTNDCVSSTPTDADLCMKLAKPTNIGLTNGTVSIDRTGALPYLKLTCNAEFGLGGSSDKMRVRREERSCNLGYCDESSDMFRQRRLVHEPEDPYRHRSGERQIVCRREHQRIAPLHEADLQCRFRARWLFR